MSVEAELQAAFEKLKERGVDTFSAEVLEVDKDKGTCKVNDGELDYSEVRLASVINERDSMVYIFPKVGSSVLVSPINEDLHQLYVEAYSDIEEFYTKIDTTEMRVNAEGILLKKGGENAQKLMLDLITAIKNMVFTTNNGPTQVLVNEPEFIALEPRIKDLYKEE